MVSNLALKCKTTDKAEITVSSRGKRKKKEEVMDVNSLFCLCCKIITSDVEKLNKFVCVCVQIT